MPLPRPAGHGFAQSAGSRRSLQFRRPPSAGRLGPQLRALTADSRGLRPPPVKAVRQSPDRAPRHQGSQPHCGAELPPSAAETPSAETSRHPPQSGDGVLRFWQSSTRHRRSEQVGIAECTQKSPAAETTLVRAGPVIIKPALPGGDHARASRLPRSRRQSARRQTRRAEQRVHTGQLIERADSENASSSGLGRAERRFHKQKERCWAQFCSSAAYLAR